MQKKCTFLEGTIQLPLSIGKRAVISHNNQTISTSTVIAIHEVSESKIVIETRNTIYCVAATVLNENNYTVPKVEAHI